MPGSQLVNLKKAAALCGRSETTIQKWVSTGELHPKDTGRRHGNGVIRSFDTRELETINARHGGRWHGERHLRPEDMHIDTLVAEVVTYRLEVSGLRAQVEAVRDELSHLRDRITRRGAVWTGGESNEAPHQGDSPQPSAHRERFSPHSSDESLATAHGGAHPNTKSSSPTPHGLVSVQAFARQHGSRESQRSTFKNAVRSGRLPVVRGYWRVGDHHVENTLDAAGRRRFWELYYAADWYQECPECPHELVRAAPITHALPSLPLVEEQTVK